MKVCKVTLDRSKRNLTNVCNMPVMPGLQYCRNHITTEKNEEKRISIDITLLMKQTNEKKTDEKKMDEKKVKEKKGKKTLSYSDEDSDAEFSDFHPEIKKYNQNSSFVSKFKKKIAPVDTYTDIFADAEF